MATIQPARIVAIAGPVGLAEVSRWKEVLLVAMAEAESLRIDLAEAGPWDLTGLQLIVSALGMGRRDGKSVRLTRVPGVFLDLLERAGGGGPINAAIDDHLD